MIICDGYFLTYHTNEHKYRGVCAHVIKIYRVARNRVVVCLIHCACIVVAKKYMYHWCFDSDLYGLRYLDCT
jgi:hypothetical protein